MEPRREKKDRRHVIHRSLVKSLRTQETTDDAGAKDVISVHRSAINNPTDEKNEAAALPVKSQSLARVSPARQREERFPYGRGSKRKKKSPIGANYST